MSKQNNEESKGPGCWGPLGIAGVILLFLGVCGLALYVLFARDATPVQLTWWAIVATVLLLPGTIGFFMLGYWFGYTKVEGFLSGVDATIDNFARVLVTREQHAPKAQAPANFNVLLPSDPRLPSSSVERQEDSSNLINLG